jgi:EAL and modified HD-GYP domain-containing signal transduction protein
MKVPPRTFVGSEVLAPASVTRQPIFGSDLLICGYELFFATADPSTDTQATETLVELRESDLDRMAGGYPAFINLTEDFILSGRCDALPRERVVLEVLEDVRPDPPVLCELARLSKVGYRIALDDFVFRAGQVPLVHLADIVKIDMLATEPDQLGRLLSTLRQFGVRLLAEKIETEEALGFSLELGFDYLQGFLLSRPDSAW